MRNTRATVVHCFRSKLEALQESYDQEHGEGTFHGSKAWLATMQAGWTDGVCCLAHDHVGDCLFDSHAEKRGERKAS